jgi:hypothetical protein
LAKENIQLQFKRFLESGAAQLNIIILTELVPNPKNYIDKCNLPIKQCILVKEEILQHAFYTNNINVIKCEICLELQFLDKQVKQRKEPHTCQKCQNRKDPMYFLRNNLHPVWYEVADSREFIRDKDGNTLPRFERPVELTRLSMAEKSLIQRCSYYVPSVHLSNGTFALKGHCVAFPQDIPAMCNELPLHKETMVVFIWYKGNKDTSAVYPKSLRVNRKMC